jgi:hypothetical protein
MSTQIVPLVTYEHCPRCTGFLVEDVLFDGSGWSNFSVRVQRCVMCQRIFEGEKQYGVEVGTLADGKCYGARQGAGG